MKFFKNIVICLSVISLITIFLVSFPVKVYADVPSSQKVVSHSGSWSAYPFNYSLQGKYFTIQDATGIPVSSGIANYFYTDDNVTFYKLDGLDLYTAILNRGVGIILSGTKLTNVSTNFFQLIETVKDTSNNKYLQGGLYDSNDNLLGYCVNDISGCYYSQPLPANTPAVDVPGELTNDVYNHYKYYNNEVNTLNPDYITYYPPSKEYVWNNINTTSNYIKQEFYDQIYSSYSNIFTLRYRKSTNQFNAVYKYNNQIQLIGTSDVVGINTSTIEKWREFATELNIDNNTLYYSDIDDYLDTLVVNQGDEYLTYNVRHSNNLNSQVSDAYLLNCYAGTNVSPQTIADNQVFGIMQDASDLYLYTSLKDSITIYRDSNVLNDVKNNTYIPDSYKSNQYLNYNPVNDNSFTLTISNIDNSQNNNSTIYQESNDTFIDNSSSGNINQTTIDNSVTEIINNYYPSDSGGGGNGGEDNPSDDDINNDSVLDALLSAIRHFFSVIGQLLGTILSGLLEVVNSILDSITGIMTNMTGIIDFISALFGWIPSPVPEVLAVGISITILFAIIRFIRG